MPRNLAIALVAAAGLLSLPLHAAEVDEAMEAFASTDGFAPQDVDAIDARLLEAFVVTGAMRPDGAASPLEKALLLVDALEPALPRTRTMLRYGQMADGGTPYAFVTVERYNFGPAIRQMVVEDFGEENTDEPEVFGVGPHVAWRIVTMPLMGQTAGLVSAARREIGEDEAQAAECGGRGCLAFEPLPDDVQEWRESDPGVQIATAYPDRTAEDTAVPARVAAEMSVAAGLAEGAGGEPFWNGPEQPEAARGTAPFLFLTIDRDLGQETGTDAMLGQTLLNDDAVAELWHRRVEFPGAVHWMQAARPRTR